MTSRLLSLIRILHIRWHLAAWDRPPGIWVRGEHHWSSGAVTLHYAAALVGCKLFILPGDPLGDVLHRRLQAMAERVLEADRGAKNRMLAIAIGRACGQREVADRVEFLSVYREERRPDNA